MQIYDVVIIGAGPGGLGCAIKAAESELSCVLLEKGQNVFQGIVDSYPRGKKVYPTIPKTSSGPFPIPDLEPSASNEPVEEKGSFQEVKHPNLIFTAIRDAQIAMADIVKQMSKHPPA